MQAYWAEKHSDRHVTPNSCSGCNFSGSINAGCSCTEMEPVAHGGPAASWGEIQEYPLQTHSALKRSHIQEEHKHGPDHGEDLCPWRQNRKLSSFFLAQGVFSPAVNLRFLLCSWAGVYFKVVFEDVRTDCQDLNVEMLKPWSVLQRAGMCSQVPAVWSGTTNIRDHILLNLLCAKI